MYPRESMLDGRPAVTAPLRARAWVRENSLGTGGSTARSARAGQYDPVADDEIRRQTGSIYHRGRARLGRGGAPPVRHELPLDPGRSNFRGCRGDPFSFEA